MENVSVILQRRVFYHEHFSGLLERYRKYGGNGERPGGGNPGGRRGGRSPDSGQCECGAEELEESVMEPFVSELEGMVQGKKILLFGSYGWGDGEWMRNWEERMKNAGAELITGEGIIANEAPDAEAVEALKAAGRAMV